MRLVIAAVVIEASLLAVLALGDLRAALPVFIALMGIAFVAYLGAAWLALGAVERPTFVVVLVAAIVFRVTALVAAPTLSDDLNRSVWEGRVMLAGLSPYALAPDHPSLQPMRDEVWAGVNNKGVPSPYPPLAQLFSVGSALISPGGIVGPKLLATLFDLGIILVLAVWLRSPARVLVYAWSPLPIVEFAHSGHNDAPMVFFLTAALALSSWRYTSAALLAIATLSKIAPILLVPLFLKRWGTRGVLLFGVLVCAGYAPIIALGGGAVGSLPIYAATWSDNDSIYFLLRVLWSPLGELGPTAAKLTSLALLVAGCGLIARRSWAGGVPIAAASVAVFGLFLALSSTVHTWYAIWLLPGLAATIGAGGTPLTFRPTWASAWLFFGGLGMLPYLTYADHQWQVWISVAQYVPLYAMLGVAAWHAAPRATVEGDRSAIGGAA
jgi:hypothetical protein